MKNKTIGLLFLTLSLLPWIVAAQTPKAVTLTAQDGTRLSASYFPADRPGPGVILLHQCNRQRHAWDALAVKLAAKGMHVLTLDYRGYGESGGRPFPALTAQERQIVRSDLWPEDIDVAVQYLEAQEGVDRNRIAAGGASCGVDQSVQLARRNPGIKSLVLLSGNTDQNGWEYLRRSPGLPVLMAAADDDGVIAAEMQWILGFSRNPKNRFLHYSSGGHGADMFPYQPDLIPAIADWMHSTLASASVEPMAAESLPPSPIEEFWTTLNEPDGAARARKMYEEKGGAGVFTIPEGALNALGYQRIQEGRADDAIEIFKINVAAYPDSANVYDSLSDAYVAAGQLEAAREYARKTIDVLNRDTTNTEAFKNQIRESAMEKLNTNSAETGRQSAQPSREDMTRMPIVLKVSGMEKVGVHRDVVYKSVEGTELKMDVYVPADARPGRRYPVVLFISGAGNDPPSPKEWGVFQTYGQLVAANGLVGIQFNKRYGREPGIFPKAEEDLKDLIAYVRANADSLNIDPERIGVVAYSAGGRLLAPFLREPVPGVRCLAAMYAILTGSADGGSDFSPVVQLAKAGQKLPLFIGRAGQDSPAINTGIDMFARDAVARGFEVTLLNHADGRHGFDILDDNDRSREIIRALVDFFQQNLSQH